VLLASALMVCAQEPASPPPPDPDSEIVFTLTVAGDLAVPSCDGGPVAVDYPPPRVLSRCPTQSLVFCDPPSGSLFRPGQTVVACWSTNACGEAATNSFTVTVSQGLAPPQITCPAPVVTYATSSNGIPVFYAVPAVSDDADPSPLLVCTPPPGSEFRPGITAVTCVATDACGRSNTCTFTVEVRWAQMRIATTPNPTGGGPLVAVTAEGFAGMDVTTALGEDWTPLADEALVAAPQAGTNKFYRPPTLDGVLRAPGGEVAYVAVGPLSAFSHPWPAGRAPNLFLDDNLSDTGVKLLSGDTGGTANNLWSGPQNLPFTFYFYGRPYQQFRVSKNGLLTFSTNLVNNTQGLSYFTFPQASTTNTLTNALPLWTNGFAVENTIFALAGRYSAQAATNGVYGHVMRQAPYRQVWIVFDHVKDLHGRTLSAIVLEETSNFIYVVDMSTTTPANNTSRLLCGLQGEAGSLREAQQIAASPYMLMVSRTNSALDNGAYLFRPYVLGKPVTGQASSSLLAATNLDRYITEQARRLNIPGLTVAISRNGRLIFNRAYGYSSVEQSTLMQPYHRACIGSVSKMFAAFGIEALIEQGLLGGLGDWAYASNRLGKPWFWSAVNAGISNNVHSNFTAANFLTTLTNVALSNLLSHTAGLNNVNNDTAVAAMYTGGDYLQVTPRQHVQWHVRTQPLFTNGVGLAAQYSNPGFKHLGVLIEEVAGQNYENWILGNLLHPAGVHHARLMRTYEWEETWRDARRYLAYVPLRVPGSSPTVFITQSPWANSRISGNWSPVEYGSSAFANAADGAAGSFTATAADLVTFLAAVDGFAKRPDILAPERFNELERTFFGTPSGQGLGWDSVSATRVWKNGGIGYGAAHLVRSRAADRLTVAVVANYGANITPLGNALWDAVNAVPPLNPNYDLFGLQLQQP
jgi:CubicO group peptidase (beta-lactamase class C family)